MDRVKGVYRFFRDLLFTIGVVTSILLLLFVTMYYVEEARIAWMGPREPLRLVSVIATWLGFAALVTAIWSLSIAGRAERWRRRVSTVSVIVASLVWGVQYQAAEAYRPVETESDARPILVRMLKHRAYSFPGRFTTDDLSRQIRNVEISGPAMTFEIATTRYVRFDLDTGCGMTAKMQAVMGSAEGAYLMGVVEPNCLRPLDR